MPSTGTCRTPVTSARGSRVICSRTSGEALPRNQRTPSALTAIEDCVRGCASAGSSRAMRHVGHQQFHCGKPPPAAVPSRITRTCLLDSEFLETIAQCVAADTQSLCGLRLIAIGFAERLLDHRLLPLRQIGPARRE